MARSGEQIHFNTSGPESTCKTFCAHGGHLPFRTDEPRLVTCRFCRKNVERLALAFQQFTCKLFQWFQ